MSPGFLKQKILILGFVLSGRRFITFLVIFFLNGSAGISGLLAVKLDTESDLQPLFTTFIILTVLITALVSFTHYLRFMVRATERSSVVGLNLLFIIKYLSVFGCY